MSPPTNHVTINWMSIEKIYTHDLIRLLRSAIPIILLVLIAIPVLNYFNRPVAEPVFVESVPKLLEKVEELQQVEVLQEGFKFSQTVGDRTAFTIEARTTLEFADGSNLLEDVVFTLYGEEGSPDRQISSDRGGYDEETENIRFEGNVEVELDEETLGYTPELVYDHQFRSVESKGPVVVRRYGQFEAHAKSLRVLIPDTLVTLTGAVRIGLEDGLRLETSIARFHQRDGWVQLSGGLKISSAGLSIIGTEGSANLKTDPFRATSATIAGGVHAEFESSGDSWIAKADLVHVAFSEEGSVESISARGTASLRSTNGSNQQALFGELIDGSLDQEGGLKSLEALGDSRMVLGKNEELHSEWIRTEPSGLVKTANNSLLKVGTVSVAGSYFEIKKGEHISFRTSHPATLETDAGRTKGNKTDAIFDLERGELIEFIQLGDVHFDHLGRLGTAGRLEVSNFGEKILLAGRPIVLDSQFRVEADTIVLDQKDGSFTASGKTRTVAIDDADPVLIVAERVDGNEKKIVYADDVRLWRKQFQVSASLIEMFPDERRLMASGDVDSTIETIHARAHQLEFSESEGVLHYLGDVQVRSEETKLSAGEVKAIVTNGEAQHVVAREAVVVDGLDFEMKADDAVYDQASQTITLKGHQAEVSDAATGTVQGRQLILNIEDNDVVVTGEAGSRVVSRRIIPQN